jgi:NAD(P)H dehydrogenase (quinone)
VTLVARDPEKAADLVAKGLHVRKADYDQPETLVPAFRGADRLLLIPSAIFGQRYPQMARAVTAAAEAGVGLIGYAGFVNSDTSNRTTSFGPVSSGADKESKAPLS